MAVTARTGCSQALEYSDSGFSPRVGRDTHTGQNYDKNLNDVFWADFDLGGPDVYLNVVGENLGQTCGNVIARSYELMAEIKPDALLVLGDISSRKFGF